MNELVSVLLPVYNENLLWIQKSVYSILEQTYNSLELVIGLDNPERKDVIQWIDEINDTRIMLYVNEFNIGIVNNLNKGLALCRGSYIARMDADDIALNTRIAKELDYIKRNRLDFAATNVIRINEQEEVIGESDIPLHSISMRTFLKRLGTIPHPTWLAKKEVFKRLNGYRNIALAEDYDFLIRAYLSGFRIGIVKEPLLLYRQNTRGITQTDKGKQRVTAFVLRRQIIKEQVICEEMIKTSIESKEGLINKYREMYKYTRFVRNNFINGSERHLKDLKGFKYYFIPYMIKDYWIERINL